MKMKLALVVTTFGLLAQFEATAQNPPDNHWDISKVDVSKLPPASDKKDLTFDKDILPLFKTSCVRCHGEQRPRRELRLDTLEGVLKGGHDGKMVVPGDSKNSLLVVAAAQIDDKTAMPPKRRARGGAGGPPGGGPGPGGQPGGPDAGPGPGPGGPPPGISARISGGNEGGDAPPGGPPPGGSNGGPGPGRGGPPPKPLTAEQVGLLRAWVDQGAK